MLLPGIEYCVKFRDGILEITIPKAEEAKPKQIKVDIG
jgi:HSP20 family molecular chaperone IbpA